MPLIDERNGRDLIVVGCCFFGLLLMEGGLLLMKHGLLMMGRCVLAMKISVLLMGKSQIMVLTCVHVHLLRNKHGLCVSLRHSNAFTSMSNWRRNIRKGMRGSRQGKDKGDIQAKSRKGTSRMDKDWIELPQTEIPDEVRQVDLPEIGETTPHPKPDSPQAAAGTTAGQETGQKETPIGFLS